VAALSVIYAGGTHLIEYCLSVVSIFWDKFTIQRRYRHAL